MAARRALTAAAVRRDLAGGDLAPLYLVTGQDEREKASLAAAFGEVVEADFRAFNVERLYGSEGNVARLLDAARTLPLMASRRVIIVQQAEALLMPKRLGEAAERDLDLLVEYFESPQPHAVLVFVAGPLDGRLRVVRALRERAVLVECGGAAEAAEAASWVRARAAEHGARIAPDAVRRLVELAGADIARLHADTERVLVFAGEKKVVTLADVEATTSRETLQDDWAMVRAVEAGDAARALRQLALLLDAGIFPLQVLGQLRWMVSTPPPKGRFPRERAAGAVEALFRTDLALKSSAGDPRVLLERLVVELCERKAAPSPAPGRRVRHA